MKPNIHYNEPRTNHAECFSLATTWLLVRMKPRLKSMLAADMVLSLFLIVDAAMDQFEQQDPLFEYLNFSNCICQH